MNVLNLKYFEFMYSCIFKIIRVTVLTTYKELLVSNLQALAIKI